MKLFILISLLITIAVATKTETKTETDLEDEKTEIKGTTTGYHHYDLAILIIILAFKFKVVLLVLAAFFGFGSYNKLLSGIGGYYKGFNKCPPQIIYDTTHKHNRDYSNADRLDRGLEYSMYYEDMDLELLSNVMKGVGLTNPNFNITESGSCRRRLVCEADRMAHTKPILGYTMQLLRYYKF
ncbi:hypothetical protein C0J52_21124 [Blattella germanica]|nr:hypothetical protein C0J52_21124 [Blattella germanica]